jgi:RsiW-degrading membrane proteinase PrsW (M82 family)
MNINRITSRYIAFAAVLFLMVVFGAKTGWAVTLLSVLVPLVWLWTFSLRHTSTFRSLLSSKKNVLERRQPAVDLMSVALCASVAWLMAPVFVFIGESLNDFFVTVISGSPLGYYILRAGLVEELLKLSAVLVVTGYLSPGAIKHPADGIVLACAAGLGFSAYENIFQNVHLFDLEGWDRIKAFLLGAFIRVPLHALYGAVWGTALGLSSFLSGPKRYFVFSSGLFAAIFLHGLWDTLVQSNSWLFFILVLCLYATLWHCYFKFWNAVRLIEIGTTGDGTK